MNSRGFLSCAAEGRRRTPSIIAVIISGASFILSGIVAVIFLAPVLRRLRAQTTEAGPPPPGPFDVADAITILIGFTALVYVIIFLWTVLYEQRPVRSLGFRGEAVRNCLTGALFGVAATIAVACCLILSGLADWSFMVTPASALPLMLSLGIFPVVWLFQATAEEMVFRGFLLQSVGQYHGAFVAILVSTALFCLFKLESGSPDLFLIAGYFLLGVFLCVYTLIEKSLWGPAGFHAAWNFTSVTVFNIQTQSPADDGNLLLDLLDRTPHLIRIEVPQEVYSISMTLFSVTCMVILILVSSVSQRSK